MGNPWTEKLEEFELSAESADAPPEQPGDWLQALAEFRKLGFARLLVGSEPPRIALHAGHPDIDQDFATKIETALTSRSETDWTVEESDGTWWLISAELEDAKQSSALATVLRLAESLRDDQPDWEWLTETEQEDEAEPDERDDTQAEEPAESDEEEKTASESAEADESGSSSPFETIGDDTTEEDADEDAAGSEDQTDDEPVDETSPPPGEFSFEIRTEDGSLEMTATFGDAITEHRESVEEALTRNLRAKFDVVVDVLDVSEVRELGSPYPRTLGLRLTPTSLTGEKPPSLDECESAVGEYMETIESLAQGGIDPLVFLGVRSAATGERSPSKKEESSRRSEIETEEPQPDASEDDAEEVAFFLVSDDEEDEPEEHADEVVLTSSAIAHDAPLEKGRFDDPRLDEPDADTSLVDVVLRHPGYSDRRVGQVLSILFSIEYYEALRLMNAAPIVIARGVSNERGHTIQNVVDGAGGRVKLTEPDRFPVSE